MTASTSHKMLPANLRELVIHQFVIFLLRFLPLLEGLGNVPVAFLIVLRLVRSRESGDVWQLGHVDVGQLDVWQLQVVELRGRPEPDKNDNDTGQNKGSGHESHNPSSRQSPQAGNVLGHHGRILARSGKRREIGDAASRRVGISEYEDFDSFGSFDALQT